MQSNPDRDMKFILVYQDHLTKFVLLRSVHSKRADEVAFHILDKFATFGATNILHSNNGREFCNQIIKRLCKMWNDIKIVQGKPRHSESQGSVERANQDIENVLATWMETNNKTKWSEGLQFVRAMKNRAYHEGIKCAPYEALFGVSVKLGIASSFVPRNLISNITTEEELKKVININNERTSDIEDDEESV
jgi:transposase InsO family protein